MEVCLRAGCEKERKSRTLGTYQFVEGYLRPVRIEHKPPRVPEDGCATDIHPNDHVSDEEPAADKRFSTVSRGHPHNGVIRGVESQRGRR